MKNCPLNSSSSSSSCCFLMEDISKKKNKSLPVDTIFKLPSPLPTFPPGGGFASGSIDVGGLKLCEITTFTKIWASGPDNAGATFFEPSPVPNGFYMLGSYAQPNNTPLFGRLLVAKDASTEDPHRPLLKQPIDYSLIWSSHDDDGIGGGYIWLPLAPEGYKAVGHVITTTSSTKPPLDKIRCVRSDYTDNAQVHEFICALQGNPNGLGVYTSRPVSNGVEALGVPTGTFFIAQISGAAATPPPEVACLKNVKGSFYAMPNLAQIQSLVANYSPWIYLHPDDDYLPASVSWFFENGALLYKKGDEKNPVRVDPTGSNLPQGGSNDGEYWLGLPIDEAASERVKRGDLENAGAYLHVKPMLGATFTDIAIWVFYPFNGPSRAKIKIINVKLGQIGQHVGDWEHLTLRVSNFNGELRSVYFSQHSKGQWVNSSELEFQGGNKTVSYSSLHGHAFYPRPGLVLQGNDDIGIRNDTAKGKAVMDVGRRFEVVSADHVEASAVVVEPPWLNFARNWGPKIEYDIAEEIDKVDKVLPGPLKKVFAKVIASLPNEVLGEEGPSGPKMKDSWNGDERA